MPTFLTGGFKMRFYANDHEPAHVHCMNGDGAVVVEIATGAVLDTRGRIKDKDSTRAVRLVAAHRDQLLIEWQLFDTRRKEVR